MSMHTFPKQKTAFFKKKNLLSNLMQICVWALIPPLTSSVFSDPTEITVSSRQHSALIPSVAKITRWNLDWPFFPFMTNLCNLLKRDWHLRIIKHHQMKKRERCQLNSDLFGWQHYDCEMCFCSIGDWCDQFLGFLEK